MSSPIRGIRMYPKNAVKRGPPFRGNCPLHVIERQARKNDGAPASGTGGCQDLLGLLLDRGVGVGRRCLKGRLDARVVGRNSQGKDRTSADPGLRGSLAAFSSGSMIRGSRKPTPGRGAAHPRTAGSLSPSALIRGLDGPGIADPSPGPTRPHWRTFLSLSLTSPNRVGTARESRSAPRARAAATRTSTSSPKSLSRSIK